MKNCLVFVLLSVLCMPAFANAQSDNDSFSGRIGIYGELGGRANPDSVGGEIGLSVYTTENLSLRAGLAFLSSESFEDTFGGINLGLRYNVGKKISPFVGFGAFGGYSEETVSAEDDRIDNDDDGRIDEFGEEKKVLNDVIVSIYPEAGIHFWATDKSRITFSGKYHFTSEGRDFDFWLFSLGFMFLF